MFTPPGAHPDTSRHPVEPPALHGVGVELTAVLDWKRSR